MTQPMLPGFAERRRARLEFYLPLSGWLRCAAVMAAEGAWHFAGYCYGMALALALDAPRPAPHGSPFG